MSPKTIINAEIVVTYPRSSLNRARAFCVHVRTCICAYVRVPVPVLVDVPVRLPVRTCVRACAYIYVHVHMNDFLYAHVPETSSTKLFNYCHYILF